MRKHTLLLLLFFLGILQGQIFSQTTVVVGIEANALTRRALADLGAPADGTIYHCTDCTAGSNPCTGSGTGATAKRDNGAWTCYDGGGAGGAPTNATYITQTPDATLTNEQALNALSNGILKHTAGVVAQAVAETDYSTPSGTSTLTNKTLDSGIATTTHAAGANFLQIVRHATNCKEITDGKTGEVCYEQDANALFVCEPTAGGCDTAGEWIPIEAATAISLAANGTNCSAGQFNKGVDASGNAESCTALVDSDIPDTLTLTGNTVDSGIATTTHAAGANFLQVLRHATNCTEITDGKDGEFCYEKDSNTVYICEPAAGDCDTAGEWILVSGGSGDNITVNGTAATNADFDDATPAAPANAINVKWQKDASAPDNISAYTPVSAPLGVVNGNLTYREFALSRNSGDTTILDIAAGSHRINGVKTAYPAATADTSAGTGLVYVYIDPDGDLTVGSNGQTIVCTNCTHVTPITAYPANSTPIGTWNVTASPNWDATITSDDRAFLSRTRITSPDGSIAITEAAEDKQLAVDGGTPTGAWDASGATTTKPMKTGTARPATCAVGEYFYDSDETAGLNTYACTATNTWTLQGDGGGTTIERISATNGGSRFVHPEFVSNFNATTHAANEVFLERFWVEADTLVTTIVFKIQTADAADPNLQLGIYNAACDTLLGSIPVQGDTVTDTAGNKAIAVSTPFTLTPGYYWFAYTTNSANVLALRRSNPNTDAAGLINQTGGLRKSKGAASTGGALNATCGTRTADNFGDWIVAVLE